jgi:ascorbate-specific PTS system EIIC-type component UlaA
MDATEERRSRLLDGLLLVVAGAGLVLGPLAALWAFLNSPCGPDSTVDVCVLAAPHATAVLLPLVAGPVAAVLTLTVTFVLRRRPGPRRRVLLAGVLVVVAAAVVPSVIVAAAPDSYPNAYVPGR